MEKYLEEYITEIFMTKNNGKFKEKLLQRDLFELWKIYCSNDKNVYANVDKLDDAVRKYNNEFNNKIKWNKKTNNIWNVY